MSKTSKTAELETQDGATRRGPMVRNRHKDAIPAKCSTQEFGQAMAQLDLRGVPPEKRQRAVMEHLMRVMEGEAAFASDRIEIAAYRAVVRQARKTGVEE